MKTPNVLAGRYASDAIVDLWSPEGKIRLEREYWIAVLKAQIELGLGVPEGTVEAYERALPSVDLDDIAAREKVTRHDVKARIESFNAAAGCECIHRGMTSRDLTENVEQLQVFRSLGILRMKAVAVLSRLQARAEEWKEVVLAARTHNVAAQPTTVGKRLAMYGEELARALDQLEQVRSTYCVRGLKGAVGTQLDLMTLFDGDREKVAALEGKVLKHLGIPQAWENVGQIYPRSLDLEMTSAFLQLASGPANLAKTLRLMAGHELASEGFAPGQVGSSAMPHKMNARSCERITGFHTLLKGYLTMASSLAGDQWNEGDVACSVVRRVLLPDATFALDGLLETTLTILGQMEIYPAVIERENRRYFPFLLSTTLLMEAVRAGAGRETAHEAIKEHAVAVAKALRSGETEENDLGRRLAGDERLGLTEAQIEEVLQRGRELTGRADEQVAAFGERVGKWTRQVPEAVNYEPGAIL